MERSRYLVYWFLLLSALEVSSTSGYWYGYDDSSDIYYKEKLINRVRKALRNPVVGFGLGTVVTLSAIFFTVIYYLSKTYQDQQELEKKIKDKDATLKWLMGANEPVKFSTNEQALKRRYKYIHFNMRGRGEVPRLLMEYRGISYDDIRLNKDQWHVFKHKLPFDQLPVLRVDERTLSQANPISRYLAREFGLAGRSNWESALCDMIVDTVSDQVTKIFGYRYESDEEKKKSKIEVSINEYVPKFLNNMENHLSLSKTKDDSWIIGEELTWADFYLVNYLLEVERISSSCLQQYPLLTDLKKRLTSIPQIKSYLERRPTTEW